MAATAAGIATSAQAGPTVAPPVAVAAPEVAVERDRGTPARAWVLPTVIAVAAALILGGIGVVIGLLTHRDPGPAVGPVAKTAEVVPGPDRSSLHQSCDQGYTLPNVSGFGSHAGRGTAETTCLFTKSVLTSYWAEYGNASGPPATGRCGAQPSVPRRW